MLNQPYQQSVGRFLLMVGVVCVLTLTTIQNTANATCGDYLSHTGQQAGFQAGPMNLPEQPQALQDLPCSGPQCQNHQPDPLPKPPLIVITSFKPACSLFSEMDTRQIQSSEIKGVQTVILSADYWRRIERPPQISDS